MTELAEIRITHPQLGEMGERVHIKAPSFATSKNTWADKNKVATFLPEGIIPEALNGVALIPWLEHPTTAAGWDYEEGIKTDLVEPRLELKPGKAVSSGVVITEPDGRVWLIHPTNQFGGYHASFPKGGAESELSLQGNALKEAFEESGLKVEITGHLGDFERTTSISRMYSAVRVGGTPTKCGWETQAVSLVPKSKLYELLNMWPDHAIAELIGAGPAPLRR